jgi:nucleoid-associated protein YgaU
MRPPEERCALSDIPAELRRLYGQTASYSVLWKAAVEGAFPAERVRNRWYIQRADLPRVAQALGIPTASAA